MRPRKVSELTDIVSRLTFVMEEFVAELEALIAPPDPPQVHIPGLDQTEWSDS